MEANEIYGRRYFYPSLAKSLPYVDPVTLKVTDDFAKRVLCLPLYFDLSIDQVDCVSEVILRTVKEKSKIDID